MHHRPFTDQSIINMNQMMTTMMTKMIIMIKITTIEKTTIVVMVEMVAIVAIMAMVAIIIATAMDPMMIAIDLFTHIFMYLLHEKNDYLLPQL